MGGLCYLRVLRRRPSVDSQHLGRGRIVLSPLITGSIRRRPASKRLTRAVRMHVWDGERCGRGVGAGRQAREPSKPAEDLEAELRELRDEVRRLREQVAALAVESARPAPGDERLPTYVGR